METPDLTARRVAVAAGHLVFGLVGTAVSAVALLQVGQPLQPLVYDAFYLAVGPWTATVTATILVFTLASLGGISVPTLLAEYGRSRFEHARALVAGLSGLLLALVFFLALTALAGANGWLAAIVAVGAFVVAVPVGLRYLGAWPATVTAFVGGVPVLVLLLLLLGFGLGWGGGYDLVAREVPASAVNGSAEASFDGVPQLRDDLLTPSGDGTYGYCERDDGRRTCRLPLRGYDHEARAARFLDRHGVRCPFLNGRSTHAGKRSFVAEDDGTYYRVSCVAYGD